MLIMQVVIHNDPDWSLPMPWQPNTSLGFINRLVQRLRRPFTRFNTWQMDCPHCGNSLIAEFYQYPADPFAFGPCPVCGKNFALFETCSADEIFLRVVRKYNALHPDHMVAVLSVEGFKVSSIRQGILFILALWSGPARASLQFLEEILSQPPFQSVKVYVVNIDTLTEEFIKHELPGVPLGGAGETFWIKDGTIQHTLTNYTSEQSNAVEDFTRSLIADWHGV